MNTYQGNLLHALENLLYRDRSRTSLKSTDLDVIELFSGDEEAVIYGLKQFHLKHADESTLIHTGKFLEVKVFDLFRDPDQENQKINWKKKHSLKETRREYRWK